MGANGLREGVLVYDAGRNGYRMRYGLYDYSEFLEHGQRIDIDMDGGWRSCHIETILSEGFFDCWRIRELDPDIELVGLRMRMNLHEEGKEAND